MNIADNTELDFDVSSSVPDVPEPPSAPSPAAPGDPTEEPPPPEPSTQPDPAAPAAPEVPDDDAEDSADPPDLASEAGRELAKKRWRSHQHRINDLTQKRREAERQLVAERAERERLARELASHRAPPSVQPEPVSRRDAAPGESFPAFETWVQEGQNQQKSYEDYIRAAARFEAQQIFAAERDRIAQEAAAREAFEQTRTFAERTAQFRTTHADYDATVGAVTDPLSALVRQAILESPLGPSLLYHLATHPEDRQQVIATNPDGRALRYLGKLEARLEAATTGPARTPAVTTAKPPIKPVGGSPVSGDSPPDPDSEDLDAHIEFYNRQERGRRR